MKDFDKHLDQRIEPCFFGELWVQLLGISMLLSLFGVFSIPKTYVTTDPFPKKNGKKCSSFYPGEATLWKNPIKNKKKSIKYFGIQKV